MKVFSNEMTQAEIKGVKFTERVRAIFANERCKLEYIIFITLDDFERNC